MVYWADYREPLVATVVLHIMVVALFVVQWQSTQHNTVSTPSFIKAVNIEKPKPRSAPKKPVAKPKPQVKKPKPQQKTVTKPKPKPAEVVKPVEKPKPKPIVQEPSFEDLLAAENLPTESSSEPQEEKTTPEVRSGDQLDPALQSELDEYQALIKNAIEDVWVRPASAKRGMQATLKLILLPGGEVLDVKMIQSSGNPAFDRSAEKAVWKVERLPVPSDPELFDQYFRQFNLFFNPEDRL